MTPDEIRRVREEVARELAVRPRWSSVWAELLSKTDDPRTRRLLLAAQDRERQASDQGERPFDL